MLQGGNKIPGRRQGFGRGPGTLWYIDPTMNRFLLLSVPRNPTEGRIFRARAEIFFVNAKANVASSLAGGVMVATVLWQYATPMPFIAAWLALFLLSEVALYLTSRGFDPDTDMRRILALVKRRTATGLVVAALFGATPLLLPVGTPEAGEVIMAMILLVLFAVILMTYYVLPAYYLAVDLVVLGPLLAHLLWRSENAGPLFIGLVVAAQLVLVPKGLHISRIGIDRLRANARLTTEIHRHREARQRIEHLALHDALTGVANRRLFKEFWNRSAKLALREDRKLGLLFVDLDDFKPVNDAYGHDAGDLVLKEIARRLEASVRDADLVSRYGGDEFYILLEDVADTAALDMLAAKLEQRVAQPIRLDGDSVTLTASIGTALFPDDGRGLEALLKAADRRMYEVKKRHKEKARPAAQSGA